MLPGLARDGLIEGVVVEAPFIDIGTPQDFERFFAGISLEDGMTQIFKHGDRIHQDEGVVIHGQNRKRAN